MVCKGCGSSQVSEFGSEICVHVRGLGELSGKPPILTFPHITICLHCGLSEFRIAEDELRTLEDRQAA
jgi:hypothetical protein